MEAGIALVWLLFWILAAVGLTHVIADSHLAELWPKAGLKVWLKKGREDIAKRQQDELAAGLRKDDDPPLDPGWWFHLWDNVLFALYCYQCSGWWCGLVSGVLMDPLGDGTWGWARFARGVGYAFAASFLAPLGAALINFMDVVRGGKE